MRNLPDVLTAILVSSLAACSGSTVAPLGGAELPPTKETDTVSCLSPYSAMPALYAQLTLAAGVDGIAFFGTQPYGRPDPDAGPPPQDRGRVGKLCAVGASCEADLAALANATAASFNNPQPGAPAGWTEGENGRNALINLGFAIVARGGTLTAVRSLEELRSWIAPIESLAEAQAWATIGNQGATCESASPNASQANANYYELRSIRTTCTPDVSGKSADVIVEVLVRVYRDGRVEAQPARELKRVPSAGCPVAGRKPAGLLEDVGCTQSASPLGNYLAEMAHLEAAAVLAFGELASELARFGAPASLVERARTAQADEVRHADVMTRRALAHGVSPRPAQFSATTYATLLDLALHNAEEGCVRETYGALVAMHQAARAADAVFRIELAVIAQEEVQHAAWSHDLDQWLHTQLTETEKAAVATAKRRAFARLERECSAPAPSVALANAAGLPDEPTAAKMLAELKCVQLAGSSIAN